jgi:hypothetical protein
MIGRRKSENMSMNLGDLQPIQAMVESVMRVRGRRDKSDSGRQGRLLVYGQQQQQCSRESHERVS